MKWLLLSVIVVATVMGDLLQSHEMKRSGEQTVNARGLARLLFMIVSRRQLLLSILCMAISFFAFMALVQIAPLSFAVPASAATFVLETLLAKFVLNEHVGKRRAAGTLLVLGGVVLLARYCTCSG
jgi:drug/metabolite transporter (DMT)-like permease